MYRNQNTIQRLIDKGKINIVPYHKEFQGPNLYYCHLGTNLLVPKEGMIVDTHNLSDDLYEKRSSKGTMT